ncbi:S8 family serine peptidase [Novosphingobium sp.]|uniref:S8 family serine peptidase n=1 Tax=Novosphingobium sp. TaxID=1874826 RepID=UPI00286B7748|nr:S8 family serine peptidase [Novosphingobium sp.]
MRRFSAFLMALAMILGPPLAAQGLLGGGLPSLPVAGPLLDGPLSTADSVLTGTTGQISGALRQARLDRLQALVAGNREFIERDLDGEPARRGVLLLIDPDPATSAAVTALGFGLGEGQAIDGLGLQVAVLTVPKGMSLAKAQKLLKMKVPAATISSDQLHFQSGQGGGSGGAMPASGGPVGTAIGIIDGGAMQGVTTRGFASGAPIPSNHGSAVVSLAMRAGARRLLVADVYGSDRAGGSALAISNALGWLVVRGARVISISLVGPRNPLVERAVRAAQLRGVIVVAAVGNDGPAAPPSYPASYPGVFAVTGVDARNRVLIEAGRAAHVDYAAPGAGISAQDRNGRMVAVRGTSFAAPLVAVRAAAAMGRGVPAAGVTAALDAEAVLLGKRRPDPKTGRGLLCATCR